LFRAWSTLTQNGRFDGGHISDLGPFLSIRLTLSQDIQRFLLSIFLHGRRDCERLFLLSAGTNVDSIGPFRCPDCAHLRVQSPARLVGTKNFVVTHCYE
jgi:hypothetical protein